MSCLYCWQSFENVNDKEFHLKQKSHLNQVQRYNDYVSFNKKIDQSYVNRILTNVENDVFKSQDDILTNIVDSNSHITKDGIIFLLKYYILMIPFLISILLFELI